MNKNNFHKVEINGASVAGYEMPGTRSVVVYAMFKAGAWYEKTGQRGFFHLLEHCIFGGSQKLPSKDAIDDYSEKYGINDNAWTGNESVGFWFKFPDINTDKALELMETLLFEPIFAQETIDKERQIITQEYGDYWNSPYKRFSKEYSKLLLGESHIYGQHPLSTIEDLPLADTKILKELHQKHFQPQNLCLSIAGNFDWPQVVKKLEAMLDDKKNGKKVSYQEEPIKTKPDTLIYKDDVTQTLTAVDWLLRDTQKLTKKERLILNMVRQMLGNNRKSLLHKKIREELGIAYQTGCRISDWKNDMSLEVWTQTDKNNSQAALNALKEAVKELKKKEYTQEEFDQTRNFINMQTLMYYDSVGNVADDMVMQMFINKDKEIYTPEQLVDIANEIKPSDLSELFSRLIKIDETYVSILTDKDGLELDKKEEKLKQS